MLHKSKVLLFIFLVLISSVSFSQEYHKVQANQTLYSIANLYGITIDQIKTWNNLTNTNLRVGQNLVVKLGKENTHTNLGLIPYSYTVRNGDTLSSLSLKFGTSVDELNQINGLTNQPLYTGEKVYIRRPVGISLYTVETGDSLSLISALFDISQDNLIKINQLTSSQVVPGQLLRVFKPKEVPLVHQVEACDTLNGLSELYGVPVLTLKKLNNLNSNTLTKGQTLRLRSYAAASTVTIFQNESNKTSGAAATNNLYEVKTGDTLYRIALNNGMSVNDLLNLNNMKAGEGLKVGQKLSINKIPSSNENASTLPQAKTQVSFPETKPEAPVTSIDLPKAKTIISMPNTTDSDQDKQQWVHYVVMDRSIPVFEWNGDYYYWTHPGEVSQPNKGYFENDWPSPLDSYRKARALWNKFTELVDKQPKLSNALDGYTFVLDPGHGGLDPGTIVKTSDINGHDLYITEDEYVYDIALRMYEQLHRNGAQVELTILAPNHLIRDTEPANHTLINEKNEVYNDLVLNRNDDGDSWPQGTSKGLEKRIDVAEKFFRSASGGKKIFISLHADNNPTSPMGTGVYYFGKDNSVDSKSKKLAQSMTTDLGKNAYARDGNLAVLRGNPADYKVLIEVHNLAFDNQAWAMRSGNSRQADSQKIVKSLLEFFN